MYAPFAPTSRMTEQDWTEFAYPEPAIPYGRTEDGKMPSKAARAYEVDTKDGHKLFVQEFGNKNGEPVIVLHGGPGGGCNTLYSRYFDPERYRIIMFDQRGCQHSRPTTHEDPVGGMKGNDTRHIVEDINTVRKAAKIQGKMHLEGGSWGATLALMYAIKYPQNVKSLQLRGAFLGTRDGLINMFQGNAALYHEAPRPLRNKLDALQHARAEAYAAEQKLAKLEKNNAGVEEIAAAKAELEAKTLSSEQTDEWHARQEELTRHFNTQDKTIPGAYRAYMGGDLPGQINLSDKEKPAFRHMIQGYAIGWDNFVRQIPKGEKPETDERRDMIEAYVNRLEAKADPTLKGTGVYDAKNKCIDPDYQLDVAKAFSEWEGFISFYSNPVTPDGYVDLGDFSDPDFAVDFARIEARYIKDGFYLTEDGSPSPGGSSYIVDNLHRIAAHNIPIGIAHGLDDQVCSVEDARTIQRVYDGLLEKIVPNPAMRNLVTFDYRPKTGHSMLEKGNTLALLNIIRAAHEITPEEKLGMPRSVYDHLTQPGGAEERAH